MLKVLFLSLLAVGGGIATWSPAEPLRLALVGDIMLDRGVEWKIDTMGNGDFNWIFELIRPETKEPDLMFGNLEGPISDRGRDVGSIYSFRMRPAAAKALAAAGFDVLSVANNHAGDWTRAAWDDTLTRLTAQGILPVGGAGLRIIERGGIRLGFLAYSDVGPGWVAVPNNFEEIVAAAAQESDFLVVSLHFGEEYQTKPSERQIKLARAAIDSGARLVVGHHPHVIQPLEHYRGGVIAYSLGNFIFDQGFSEATMSGRWLEVVLAGSEIQAVKERTVRLNQNFQPSLMN